MDDRLKKNLTAGRESRDQQDASREGAEESLVSSAERRRMFRNEFLQESLPQVHGDPNWHYCWLSSTNQYDPLHKRTRMGYVPVMATEISDLGHLQIKEGDRQGQIQCNEMLLFKLPMEVYQEYMQEVHHYQPMEEADKIRVQQEQLLDSTRDSAGKPLVTREGDLVEVSRGIRVPTF